MSTLVITAHVKEGIALAGQYRLPPPIIRGIQQHHGTSLIQYFYHRAKQQHENGNGDKAPGAQPNLNKGDFRYEGPRPSTREMGILLLADSVEAASRAMTKPTASKIEALVHEIVEARLQDHQLDECDLTLAELAAIRHSFVFTLTGMLHGRIDYPQDESRSKQQATAAPGGPGEDQGLHEAGPSERATA